MQIGTRGINLIKQQEGCKLTAYFDCVGVLTIGYGHTGKDVHVGMVITPDEAYSLLIRDLMWVEPAIARLVKVPLNQNEFDALASFTFNEGAAHLATSTLLRQLNDGDRTAAAAEFDHWTMAGGRRLDDLVRRRAAERALFLEPGSNVISLSACADDQRDLCLGCGRLLDQGASGMFTICGRCLEKLNASRTFTPPSKGHRG